MARYNDDCCPISILQLAVSADINPILIISNTFSPPASRSLPLGLGIGTDKLELFSMFDPDILTDIGTIPILMIASSHPYYRRRFESNSPHVLQVNDAQQHQP